MKNPLILSLLLLLAHVTFSQALNDACTNAQTLTVSPDCSVVSGSLYNVSNTTVSGSGNCGTKRDVWYRFTVPLLTTSVRIAVTLTSSPSTLTTGNTYIELLNGNSCPTGSTHTGGCNNISSSRTYGGLTPGGTYLFRVYTTAGSVTSGGATAYDFNICVTANDNCTTASLIVPGTTLEGSLRGASATALIPIGTSTGDPDDDLWYKFTAVYDYASIVVSNIGADLSASGVRLQLFSGACGALSPLLYGTNTINATGLSPDVEYYVRVFSAGTGQSGSNYGYQFSVYPSATARVTAGRMKEVYNQQTISAPQALLDPWEVTYAPDGKLWITEAKGYRLYRYNSVTGARDTILDVSQNSTFLPVGDQPFNCQFANGSGAQGGFAGMAIHPKFMDATMPENYVYVSYVHSKQYDTLFTNRIVRFTYNTSTGKLESPVSICDTLPGSNDHNSQRMIIAPVGSKYYLFYASGDMGAGQFKNNNRVIKAQMINSYEGKILRFNLEPDGDTPGSLNSWIPSTGSGDDTNPYNATLGVQSAVWSIGVRNNQGFAYDPVLNKLYGSSHGPFSDDEINVIERGKNYGHPLVIGYAADGNVNNTTAGAGLLMSPPHPSSCPMITNEAAAAAAIGITYKDPLFSAYPNSVAFPSISDLWNTTTGGNGQWPSEGWSGLDLYTKSYIPGWKKSLIAASLKWGRLVRLKLNSTGTTTAPTNTASDTVSYFGSTNRFRDVAFSPDGKDIYVIMDRSISTSGPSAANPIITSCQGCLQKYTFLGYEEEFGKSSIPTSIDITDGAVNTCNPGTSVTIDGSNNTLWVPITGADGNILAEINANGQNLGTIYSSFYKSIGPIRSRGSAKYLDRNIQITPQVQPSGSVKVRFYISKSEFDALDADPASMITSLSDLKIHKNGENCQGTMTIFSKMINPSSVDPHGSNGYVLQANINGFSSFYFGAANLTLPVNLVTFSGNYKNETSYLKWETSDEINTDYFVLERSSGNEDFTSIGTIYAKGSVSQKTKYNFDDETAATLGVNKLNYRLKIVDRDGTYSYSNIVVINISGNIVTHVTVFPNPADKQAVMLVTSPGEQKITWQLVDMSGRPVMSKDIVIRKGDNRITLDIQNLRPGTYLLRVTGPSINALEKIQKQ